MPTRSIYDYDTHRFDRRVRAENQVATKFPSLIRGSSGWHRAVKNRLRRRVA